MGDPPAGNDGAALRHTPRDGKAHDGKAHDDSALHDSALHHVALGTLPHRGRAHLLHRIVESSAAGMTAVGRFPPDSPLAHDGRVPTYVAVEPAAQTAAAHLAVLAIGSARGAKPLHGFLTSVKNMTITRPWLPTEADLIVRVVPRGGARGLFKYQFELELDGVIACRGELSTFVSDGLS
jgi:predicted hotdog family 3-hydroxylacyl-ACP dehydratase